MLYLNSGYYTGRGNAKQIGDPQQQTMGYLRIIEALVVPARTNKIANHTSAVRSLFPISALDRM